MSNPYKCQKCGKTFLFPAIKTVATKAKFTIIQNSDFEYPTRIETIKFNTCPYCGSTDITYNKDGTLLFNKIIEAVCSSNSIDEAIRNLKKLGEEIKQKENSNQTPTDTPKEPCVCNDSSESVFCGGV
jgi:hypothetical protein